MGLSHEGQSHRTEDELSSLTIDEMLPLDNPLTLAETLTPSQIQDMIAEYTKKSADLRIQQRDIEIQISNSEGRLATLYEAAQLAQDKNPGI